MKKQVIEIVENKIKFFQENGQNNVVTAAIISTLNLLIREIENQVSSSCPSSIQRHDGLKCCPFCGCEEMDHDEHTDGSHYYYWIECPDCNAEVQDDTKELTYKKWNSRAYE